ncbi:DUF421 domain-containing protein [Taibaiella sp. KBW10]|uniref:YetF domain-containing protein n=1 Tax=Taibaiella sp. KBW10 TaxID=2153357 RepID=UPI000F5940E7|nr:YetF domain-containing protein [Taibaiella sp. KBW10]RQO32496.1 DUF421 domain-containing protein [Taibaiella sp. KBW10]
MRPHLLQAQNSFSWKEVLLGKEDWVFLGETALRTVIMFTIIMIALRILGKRGVKQLSVFELVVIIGLGSAAGDPMFYKDVGILPSLAVFTLVIGMYTTITYLIGKHKKFEQMVEGKPICLIKNGAFSIENFRKETLGEDEFFAELRLQSVSQLGQIEQAIVEVNGSISIFYYPDEEVKYGLPIMPGSLDQSLDRIDREGHYSCTFCGHTQYWQAADHTSCPDCRKNKWVPSSNKKRIR